MSMTKPEPDGGVSRLIQVAESFEPSAGAQALKGLADLLEGAAASPDWTRAEEFLTAAADLIEDFLPDPLQEKRPDATATPAVQAVRIVVNRLRDTATRLGGRS